MVPGRRPRGERSQLADKGQRAEEEVASAHCDHQEHDQHRDSPLAPGAQRRGADPPTETVSSGATAQIVKLVEVAVLAEGSTHAAREDGHLRPAAVRVTMATRHGHCVGRIEALVGEPAQVARKARAPAQLQPPDLGVWEHAAFGQLAPEQRDLAAPVSVPPPRPQHGAGSVRVSGQERDHHLSEGQQRSLWQHADEGQARIALEHGTELVSALQRLQGGGVAAVVLPAQLQGLQASGDRLAMADPRLGRHDHPCTGDLASPREVEVLSHRHDPGIEALELREEVGADEDAPSRRDEDITHGVVLAVIDFSLQDPVHHRTRLVAAHADVEEDARIVPVDELGGHDAGVGPERLLHQLVDGVRIERHVVVAQQVERGALDHTERLVRRRGVARAPGEVAHEGIGEDPPHPLGDFGALPTRGEDQDRELLVVLGRQGRQRLVEPRARVGRDHDGDHGRHLGVHKVPEAIRSLICLRGRLTGTKSTPNACYCLTVMIL